MSMSSNNKDCQYTAMDSRAPTCPSPSPLSATSSSADNSGGAGGGAPKRERVGGFFVSTRLSVIFLTFTTTLLFLHIRTILYETTASAADVTFSRTTTTTTITNNNNHINSVNQLRATQTATITTATAATNEEEDEDEEDTLQQQEQCGLYLAESAVGPQSGMGIFTGIGLHPGDTIGIPDICIFVSDIERPIKEWMHLRTHTFGRGSFFNQYEGRSSRAACEGLVTNVNTMPPHLINTVLISPYLATNGGLHRMTSPGAGAITQNYGIHGQAMDIVTAGSELTIDYGDWDFTDEQHEQLIKPERPLKWLYKHGWCIDNIDIRPSTYPQMGRGAFARRFMKQGQVIAPAPLQILPDRSVFSSTVVTTRQQLTNNGTTTMVREVEEEEEEEQLFVNYCYQPKDSNFLLFPYGQGVGLINHASTRRSGNNGDKPIPNVTLKWSKHYMHHVTWLDLESLDEFWKHAKPGGLILEVVALRDISPGEELFYDYGEEWEMAWEEHVSQWKPMADDNDNNNQYVYPFEIDETQPLRTVKEQMKDPYPSNLVTMCSTPDWTSRGPPGYKNITWYDPTELTWWQSMTYCHILDRVTGPHGDDVYTVQLIWHYSTKNEQSNKFNESIPFEEMYIDQNVPRRAIRFVDKPFADDEHLPNAFRHPIGLPDDLEVPEIWKTAKKKTSDNNHNNVINL